MSQAIRTYADFARAGMSPRDLEAGALLKAAGKLQAALNSGEDVAREEALAHNRRLWTVLYAAVADPGSPLPADIRSNIASLATYVFNQTMQAGAHPSSETLDRLIALNKDIAAGLRG